MKRWLLILSVSILAKFCIAQDRWVKIIDTNKALGTQSITIVNDFIYSITFKLNNGEYDNIFGKHHTLNNTDNYYNINFANKNTFSFGSFVTCAYALHHSKINNKFYAVGYESATTNTQTVKGLFCKFDKNLKIDTLINNGDTNFNYRHNQILDFDTNTLLIGSSHSIINSSPFIRRIGLLKCDTNGVVVWQDTFTGTFNKEWLINMELDYNKNTYINGVYSYTPGYNEDVGTTLKKVSSAGVLLRNVYLPYRRNSAFSFLLKLGSNIPRFIVVNAFRNDTINWPNLGANGDEESIHLTYLDSNLDIYKTVDIYDSKCKALNGNTLLNNGKMLLFGNGSLDSIYKADRYGWARMLDTMGNTIWERNYIIHDSTFNTITDAKEDAQGNLFMSGFAWGSNTINKQVGFILKVDSNGCLDTTFCYPLGIHEVKKMPAVALVLYPNPASNTIHLSIPDAQYAGGSANIYNAEGKLMQRIHNVQSQQTIDVSGYANGLYYLQYSKGDWRGGWQFATSKLY